jgi:hypothetical protein
MSTKKFMYEFSGTSVVGEGSCLGVGSVSQGFEFLIVLSLGMCSTQKLLVMLCIVQSEERYKFDPIFSIDNRQ